ncbi:MAG: ArnT family glycosyltransferase [Chthoniobacterales bacterium]
MTTATRFVLVLTIWAAVYLPGLGSLEIKGEEGRRILPAITMLETGNFVVPYVGSDPYFTKPPLVNWLVAASFKLFGARNEWTARLPSALSMLMVALAFITVARRSLGDNGSVVAALAWLTNFGMIEKGRLIEIEAVYTSLTGLAFICWFAWYLQKRSTWLSWTVPWIFLGLGCLAKGPLHLVFFYAVVVSVLYQRREVQQLRQPAHVLGIALMLTIFATWAVPCLMMMHEANVTNVWSRQFSGRLSGESFHFASWILNIPRGLAYFLPWLLVFAVAGRVEFADEQERRTLRGLGWGIAISFLVINLLPGSLPRYTMPLLVPTCCLLAMIVCAERLDLRPLLNVAKPAALPPRLRVPSTIALIIGMAMLVYGFAIVPILRHREKVRTIAAQIDAAIPANEPLYTVDPDYQPFLFYVHAPIRYVRSVAEVPNEARFVLVQPQNRTAIATSAQWSPRHPQPLLPIKDYRGRETTLFRIE